MLFENGCLILKEGSIVKHAIYWSNRKLHYIYFAMLSLALVFSVQAIASENPYLIKDVNTLPLKSDSLCGAPVEVNGVAYFCAIEYLNQLWQTDGTADGRRHKACQASRRSGYPVPI